MSKSKKQTQEPAITIKAFSTVKYGAKFDKDNAEIIHIFVEQIREGKSFWKRIGKARWSEPIGLHAIPSGISASAAVKLATAIRKYKASGPGTKLGSITIFEKLPKGKGRFEPPKKDEDIEEEKQKEIIYQ